MEFSPQEFYVEDISPTHYTAIRIKKIIFDGRSEYQSIRVLDTHDFGKMLVLDGTIQTAEIDEYIYHEVLVHPPMFLCDAPQSVLVIGGGDGGMIEEVEKHPNIAKIDMVEIDEKVIEVSRENLRQICGDAFRDPRLDLIIGDGRKYIRETSRKYDVVILDLTDPIGPSKLLYTLDFYREIEGVLKPGGVIATHGGGWFNFPKVSSTVFNTLRRAFAHVVAFPCLIPSYGMELAFFYASNDRDPASVSRESFQAECRRSGLELRYVSPDFVHEMKGQSLVFRESLSSTDRVSTDDDPFEFQDFYPWETI